MANILLISKRHKNINSDIFTETCEHVNGERPENIFHAPSRLIEECGLDKALNDEPFKNIRSAGTVWEFSLLRFLKIGRRAYNPLIKPVYDSPIPRYSARRLGNPYHKWKDNYPRIENNDLKWVALSFAKKLVSRGMPIREAGSSDFMDKRKAAAKAFFKYLLGGRITKELFLKLRDKDFQSILTRLIKENPGDDLFVVVGLMTCLYGGKNASRVDTRLAHIVASRVKAKNKDNPVIKQICRILYSKTGDEFSPPFKDIYDPRGGNRELVLIRFRVTTWLKLIGDTLDASK